MPDFLCNSETVSGSSVVHEFRHVVQSLPESAFPDMPKIIQTRWLTSVPVAQYVAVHFDILIHFDEIVEFLSGSSSQPALVSLRELNIRDLSPVLAIFHDQTCSDAQFDRDREKPRTNPDSIYSGKHDFRVNPKSLSVILRYSHI
jgi:hypothetical protein